MRHLRRYLAILSLLLVAALQAGCAARQIRAAQDAFNEGARSENAQRVATLNGGQPPVDAASAAVSYRTALQLLEQELQSHTDDLRNEQLLGTAMMLRAMALWRLADLEAGSAVAPNKKAVADAVPAANSDAYAQLGTRDRVMAAALPGLCDHDRGLQATSLDEASEFFVSSYTVVHAALQSTKPPENHPIRTYMALVQLSTLRSYQSAIYRFVPNLNAPPQGNGAEEQKKRAIKTVANIHTCAKLIVLQLKPVLRDDVELKQFVELVNTAIGIDSVDSISVQEGDECPFDS